MQDLMNSNDPAYIPGCPQKYIEIHNGRVFAKQRIPANTVIEVVRGLIVDGSLFDHTSVELFMWRSLVREQSMLLLGNGALYRGRTDYEQSNVKYSWYSEVSLPAARVDESGGVQWSNNILCKSTMLIQFTASRDINTNEELIIDLYKVSTLEAASRDSEVVVETTSIGRYAEFDTSDCF